MALPNLWGLYNLRSSPFFQATLSGGSDATPLTLFVGRTGERQRLLAAIGGSRSSRQAVAGRPGVGKTTLVQVVKADAIDAGYWASDGIIPLTAERSSEELMGLILAGAYDAVLTSRPEASGPALEAAQQLVRSFRLRSGGLSISAFGLGAGGTASTAISSPPSALVLDAPRVLRDLLAYALDCGAQGVLLHLDNLENLSEADAERSADLLRGLRDPVMLLDGLHLIVVGTTDAVRTVVQRHPQIRSVFAAPVVLEPMAVAELHALLEARYRFLRLEQRRPLRAPVERSAVESLYALYRGDLRGLLKALEDGVTSLLGLNRSGGDGAPVGAEDLRLVLQQRYQLELQETIGTTHWPRLQAWAEQDAQAIRVQAELVELWHLKQPSVSQALRQLTEAGAVEALPRQGGDPIRYVLSGPTRLALASAGLPMARWDPGSL
jgi:hypothetical protein